MCHKISFALTLLVVAQFANGQELLKGKCPEPSYLKKLDLERFMGKWFQWARYPHILELGQKCSVIEYTLNENGTVTTLNSRKGRLTGKPISVQGTATILGPGIWEVSFSLGANLPEMKQKLTVVATDYKNYAVIVSCKNLLGTHAQYVWALTRQENPNDKTVAKIKEALEANECPLKYLHKVDQLNCSHV